MSWNENTGFEIDSISVVLNYYFETHKEAWQTPDLTFERFKGSKEYELYYTAAQVDLFNQGYFAQTFEKLKDYIKVKNLKIKRPVCINDRIIERFAEPDFGLVCAVRAPTAGTAGILAIALDYTQSTELDARIAKVILNECAAGGVVTDGPISTTSSINNGQSFPVKWSNSTKKDVALKYTIVRSRNSLYSELSKGDIRDAILKNWADRMSMGLDVEPQRYLTLKDLPWASGITGERKVDGVDSNFTALVYKSSYSDLFTPSVNINDISVVDPV
ncbi:putative coil containing protein [Vibrio phage 236O40-1]|nr:putative coil containing protein [Vibrio phage 236O40-1]